MNLVVVNGRTPRPHASCAWCCKSIGESYVRDLVTRLSYCDHECCCSRAGAAKVREGIMITIDASRYAANGSHIGSCPARHRPDFSILDVNAQGLRATPGWSS
jgi:hypothetical protein